MGSSSSHYEPQPVHHQSMEPAYPDLNMIVKGIPKMIQVADDMHRMTNYLGDLRNMTLGMAVMSAIGIMLFLILKYVQGNRKRRHRHRLYNHSAEDSYHSSLNRPIRQYTQKQLDGPGWQTPTQVKIDMGKMDDQHHNQAPPPPPKPHRGSPTEFTAPGNNGSIQPNGHMIKPRYGDPVKLVVDDLPYADS